jgi:hypothetical protein
MTSWLSRHAISAERGDRLRPELRLLLERLETPRHPSLRGDAVQSEGEPKIEVAALRLARP